MADVPVRLSLVEVPPVDRDRIANVVPDAILTSVSELDTTTVEADAILCPWQPNGRAVCVAVKESGLRVPVIVLLDPRDNDVANIVSAMRTGASGVIVTDRLERLKEILERDRDIVYAGPPSAAMQRSELRFRSLWDSPIILITVVGQDGMIVDANDAFSNVLGWTREELRTMSWAKLTPAEWDKTEAIARAELLQGAARPWEKEVFAKDGRRVPILASAVLMPGKPLQALAFAIDLTERKRVDRELHERVRIATATAEFAVALTEARNLDGMLQHACDALEKTFGLHKVELWMLDEDALRLRVSAGSASDERPMNYPLTIGGELVGMIRLIPKQKMSQIESESIVTIINATALGVQRARAEERKDNLEAELRQAQKMEALGRLAGGIAHDFNNLLSVIIGFAQLVLMDVDPNSEVGQSIHEIEAAGNRAKVLTTQLLAFSRRQVLQPHVFDLDRTIADLHSILQRLLSEAIELVFTPPENPHLINADPNQMEQVLMNLVANARDAIRGAGRVTITTDHVVSDGRRYVRLTVTDTGSGMDANTLAHLFEPFFTTKEKGKGTGLGLATVYGIVQQSGGTIDVVSELGHGSSFILRFPAVDNPARVSETKSLVPIIAGGQETILLCEDDRQVRILCRDTLRRYGYKIIEAATPDDALRLSSGAFDMLLTDVVMPVMSGRQLAERIRNARPTLPVLFMSGYTTDHALLEEISRGVPFLQKPFTPDLLAKKVREVLDSAPSRG